MKSTFTSPVNGLVKTNNEISLNLSNAILPWKTTNTRDILNNHSSENLAGILEARYEFETINSTITMTPMRKLFSGITTSRFRGDMQGMILPNRCYRNALIAAEWFKSRGIKVEVVDGYVFTDTMNKEDGSTHRFLKYGDKYFDPTLEYLFGLQHLDGLNFFAVRSYEYETIRRFYADMHSVYGELYFSDTFSGIGKFYYDGFMYEFETDIIGENGEYVFRNTKEAWEGVQAMAGI